MTHIPKRIIAADENDLIKAEKEFFQWPGGKGYGVELITLEQAKAKGINLSQDNDIGYPINQLTEKAENFKHELLFGGKTLNEELKSVIEKDLQKLTSMFDDGSETITQIKTRELELFEKFKGNSRAQRRANKNKIRYK